MTNDKPDLAAAEKAVMVEKVLAQMTPERMREMVEFCIDVGIAAVIAGATDEEPIPVFILRLAKMDQP